MVTLRFALSSRQTVRWMLAILAPLLALNAPALADPPPWAPAHGYYKQGKHKHKYKHKDARRDDRGDLLPWLAGAAAAAGNADGCRHGAAA